MAINVKELVKKAHDTAITHGWWDNERPMDEQVANFHAEVSEAWEEYRSGAPIEVIYYSKPGCEHKEHPLGPTQMTPRCGVCGALAKPEGFTVELADLLIRLMDSAGKYGWDVAPKEMLPYETVAELVVDLHFAIGQMWCDETWSFRFNEIVGVAVAFCKENNLPLERALQEKMDYNDTRPYRHGNKLA